MDYDWLVGKLIRDNYVEDGPDLDKAECQELLDMISKTTGKTYMLIVNINIEQNGFFYDYILDEDNENKVHIEEWDNRYL